MSLPHLVSSTQVTVANVRTMAILLVENEPMLRQGLTKSLVARGHTVQEAGTCQAGLSAALDQLPDLLLLDINLPDGTGWDILRELRARRRAIPSIVFSAVPPSASRVREFEPLGVLHKPFPIDALIRLVAMVNRSRQNGVEDKEQL
jgi:DNA-binding response OmpR family regulator